jgi:hypothetical protein
VLSVDGSTVIVTQVLEGFQSLDGWVRGKVPTTTEPARDEGPTAAQVPAGGGFTELFRPPGRPAPAVEAPPPARSSDPSPGFTELFAAPPRSATPPAPSPPAPPPRTPVSSVPPVRMVDLRVPQPRRFEGGEAPPPPLRPNLSGGGGASPPVPTPPPVRASEEPLISAPPPRPITPPPPPAWSGPSDFTRQLERGPHLGSDAPSVLEPPPPPEPPPARSGSIVPLLVATNLISMLVTALIVYFAFGRN